MFIFIDFQYNLISCTSSIMSLFYESSVIYVLKWANGNRKARWLAWGFSGCLLVNVYLSLGSAGLQVDVKIMYCSFPSLTTSFLLSHRHLFLHFLSPVIIIRATLKAREMVTSWLINSVWGFLESLIIHHSAKLPFPPWLHVILGSGSRGRNVTGNHPSLSKWEIPGVYETLVVQIVKSLCNWNLLI